MSPFFHRLEGLTLLAGNKTSGFSLILDAAAAQEMANQPVKPSWLTSLQETIEKRVARSGLVNKEDPVRYGVELFQDSLCPAYFYTDKAFGGSVGADPTDQGRLLEGESGLSYIGPFFDYTPHNVDMPSQAMLLMLMIETWAEWAYNCMTISGKVLIPFDE